MTGPMESLVALALKSAPVAAAAQQGGCLQLTRPAQLTARDREWRCTPWCLQHKENDSCAKAFHVRGHSMTGRLRSNLRGGRPPASAFRLPSCGQMHFAIPPRSMGRPILSPQPIKMRSGSRRWYRFILF